MVGVGLWWLCRLIRERFLSATVVEQVIGGIRQRFHAVSSLLLQT